jgi:thioredoxin reductase
MENRNLLENLLNKYLSGKLTISERRSFFDLLATDSNETVFKELILNHISEFTHENSFDEKAVDFDSVYKNILSDIKVNRNMETNIPGLYAAGDCAGKPYQLAKAVGEGQIAALSAVSYINSRKAD